MTNPVDMSTYERERSARLNRWRKPLVTRRERWGAWLNMFFADHGFIRLVYLNLHRISPNAWRSAQPMPHQIRRLARQGLRSVVNLRGGQSYGSLPLEQEVCASKDVNFEVFVMRSRALPAVEDILAAKALFERLEYPVLFHCKSGADRAGLISGLYLALHEGVPVSEARAQLGLRYGHVRHGKTGVLDTLFDAYLTDHPDEAVPLIDWIETRYDPKALTENFKASGVGNFVTETVLRRE
ncbi:MAG: sulfur transferase domain-containing protein [Pseudomonadota bacterium]